MPPIKRFWRSLPSIPGAATSRFEWQALLGEEWSATAPLLRATGALVARVRCPSPGGDGCPRRVVRHRDGRIVAVCGDPEGQCDTINLTLDDIVVHELDLVKLADALCRLLGLDLELQPLSFAGPAWQVGWYEPVAGQRFAMVLVLPVEGDQAHHARCAAARSLRPAFSRGDAHPHGGRATDSGVSARRQVAPVCSSKRCSASDRRPAGSFCAQRRTCWATFVVTSSARFGSACPSIDSRRRRAPAGTTSRSASSTATKWSSGGGQERGVFNYAHMGMAKPTKTSRPFSGTCLATLLMAVESSLGPEP